MAIANEWFTKKLITSNACEIIPNGYAKNTRYIGCRYVLFTFGKPFLLVAVVNKLFALHY